jgi:hypothetical protein
MNVLSAVSVGCVAEAISYVFAAYCVFNCCYPSLWHMVFGFFEEIINIPPEMKSVKSSISIRSFFTKIAKAG